MKNATSDENLSPGVDNSLLFDLAFKVIDCQLRAVLNKMAVNKHKMKINIKARMTIFKEEGQESIITVFTIKNEGFREYSSIEVLPFR